METPATAPTISIVIPCYNAEAFLRSAVESALGQTHPPIEVIVVDDGSVDASSEVAESFGPPVRVIRQTNQGPSIARNVGTAASQGDYLMYLDADDLLAPEALARLASAVRDRPGVVGLMSCAVFEDSPLRPTAVHAHPYEAFFPHIIRAMLRNPICWLTPRALFDEVGGFADEARPFEDWDFWARIALTGAELACVDYVGGYYRRHPAAIMKTVAPGKRALGHARVMARLAVGVLDRPRLLERWGTDMFWSAWTAMHRARERGVPWSDLAPLTQCLEDLARRGPADLRQSRFASFVRLVGVRWATRLRAVGADTQADVPVRG